MILTKRYFILQVLFLVYLLHMSYSLKCKTCEKNNQACLFGQNVEIRNCANDNDVCYSWLDRTKGQVAAQRGCMSPDTSEYKMIKEMIGYRDSECVKRIHGLDCFKFCSKDKCN